MFRKLALVLFIISGILTISAQEKSDREKSGLFGYVKSVTEYTAEIEFKNGKPFKKERKLDSIQTFDIAGKKLTYFVFTNEGKILYGDTFIYDAAGKLVEKRTQHSRFVYLCDKYSYFYDTAGRLAEQICYVDGRGAMGKYVSRYNENGKLSEKERIPLIVDPLYFREATLTRYRYDEKGELAETTDLVRKDNEWKPDERSLSKLTSVYFSSENTRSSTELQYDMDGKLKFVITSFDDEKGNELESITYFADETIKEGARYEYQYDKQGNIIKQTESVWITEDGKSFFRTSEITSIKIEYFNQSEIEKLNSKNTK